MGIGPTHPFRESPNLEWSLRPGKGRFWLSQEASWQTQTEGAVADTGDALVVTILTGSSSATDKGWPLVVTGGHLANTANPPADIRGPLTKMGDPLAVIGGSFANTIGLWVSGVPLDVTGELFLECYWKRISCLGRIMLKPAITGD